MRIFIAQTLDGFIAGEDDSLDHLVPFQQNDYGYDAMLSEVDAVVLGRRTFDLIFPAHGWHYPRRLHGVVVTRRPLPAEVPSHVVGIADPARIAARWPAAFVDGGARTIQAFLALGAIDRATLFTLPVRIGTGVRLFQDSGAAASRWELIGSRSFPCGTVAADYRVPARRGAASVAR